ncbi:MAG: helix-turn-helix domain-containing protein [Chloroflexota bacterium]
MTLKVDSDKLRLWRKERLWSQEQAAEQAGISLRTIQRIESGGAASQDSAVALANAYDMNVNELLLDEAQQIKKANEKQASKGVLGLKMSFGIHLASFVIGGFPLLVIDLIDNPAEWWSIIPLAFWGVGLVAHGGTAYMVEYIEKMKRQMEELETAS